MSITPRVTRLVRVPDLHAFRAALVTLACAGDLSAVRHRLVVVPTGAARSHLLRTIEQTLPDETAVVLPDFITPGELPMRFADRLPEAAAVRMLSPAEREVLLGACCRTAIERGADPPFQLRPGLVAELLAFYDGLLRHQKDIATFERLTLGVFDAGALEDRGAERLARQTRFMAAAFTEFERRCEEAGGYDEHRLRRLVVEHPAPQPWRHVVLAVGDETADPFGLSAADWDLLARVQGLERLDVVATDGRIAGAFHERIHRLLPGIEEVRMGDAGPEPAIIVSSADATLRVARDREEEVAGFARWVRALARTGAAPPLDRMAIVVRRPLPYVYLTREVLAAAGVPCQTFDALPLAAEPFAAALDLVFTCVRSQASRAAATALLRSPHFRFTDEQGEPVTAVAVAALDRALSEAGYLGETAALRRLVEMWREEPQRRKLALAAAEVLLPVVESLEPLRQPATAAEHLDVLLAFLRRHEALPGPDDPLRARQLRARAAVLATIAALRDAYAGFDDEIVEFESVASAVKRWIDGQTFAPRAGDSGVHLVDADSACFGNFDAVQLAGLVDGEWPERPRRNIFCPPGVLRDLGWPSETERLEAARAAFRDLLRLPSAMLAASTFTLEDDALVSHSSLVDEIERAGLARRVEPLPATRIFRYEALAMDPVALDALTPMQAAAAARRLAAAERPQRIVQTGGHRPAAYSVSALERYQDCPFKYFAADVLRLEEPPEDEPALSPRARGRFIHEVFQQFFERWDRSGHGTITAANLDEARAMFAEVAEPFLARLPDAHAALERARLFGSAIATGIVDVVLGLEASRPEEVHARKLEHRLEGEFSLGSEDGRRVPLRGVADRIDLMAGNRLRVIDYKTGYPPQPGRALQVPVYALCAQEQLAAAGEQYQIDEAAYVAFSGKRALVPVIRSGREAAEALAEARARLFETVDAVASGMFPPRPYEMRICSYCAFPSVCRKDYVGDE